jgi:hypothetical protein
MSRATEWPLPDLIAELKHLSGSDEPASIAERLGYKPGSLYRRLHRNGLDNLAAPFARVDTYQRFGWGRGS